MEASFVRATISKCAAAKLPARRRHGRRGVSVSGHSAGGSGRPHHAARPSRAHGKTRCARNRFPARARHHPARRTRLQAPGARPSKEAVARAFAADFGVEWARSPLTAGERERLSRTLPEFQSESWIGRRTGSSSRQMLKAIHRGRGGVIHLMLDADAARGRIRSAKPAGRLLRFAGARRLRFGKPLQRRSGAHGRGGEILAEFFEEAAPQFASLGVEDFARVFRKALDKLPYLNLGFSQEETNDLFPVCGSLPEVMQQEWGWFLLPYCAKDLDCALRQQDGCTGVQPVFHRRGLRHGRAHSLKPLTIVSFENLQDHLRRIRAGDGRGSSAAAARVSTPSTHAISNAPECRAFGRHGQHHLLRPGQGARRLSWLVPTPDAHQPAPAGEGAGAAEAAR